MCYCIAAKLLKMSRGSGDEFPEVIVLYALRALRSRVFYMPQVSSGFNSWWNFDSVSLAIRAVTVAELNQLDR